MCLLASIKSHVCGFGAFVVHLFQCCGRLEVIACIMLLVSSITYTIIKIAKPTELWRPSWAGWETHGFQDPEVGPRTRQHLHLLPGSCGGKPDKVSAAVLF